MRRIAPAATHGDWITTGQYTSAPTNSQSPWRQFGAWSDDADMMSRATMEKDFRHRSCSGAGFVSRPGSFQSNLRLVYML